MIYNKDCMEAMKEMSDNQFDLAIVDPPYGIGAGKVTNKPHKPKQKNGKRIIVQKNTYEKKDWDSTTPDDIYFTELKRVSKEQIIWGANYYDFFLGSGRIIWDKLNGESDQQDAEVAYTSIHNSVRIIRYMWQGMFQGVTPSKKVEIANRQIGNKSLNEKRIHPTQKPVKLYEWLLMNYAKEGDKILDTHLGSGSIALACHNLGYDLTGYEIDKDYYESAIKRIEQHKAQQRLF